MSGPSGSLRGRLLVGSALLVVGLSASFVVLFTLREVRSAEASLDARGRDLAGHLARLGRLGVLAGDRSALRATADAALAAPGVLRVRYVVGEQTLFDGRRGEGRGRPYAADVVVAAAADDEGLDLFDGAAGPGAAAHVAGRVEVSLDTERSRRMARDAMITGALLMAVFLLAGLGAAWILARRVLDPLAELADSVRGAAGGDLERRVPAHGPAEIAELGRAYNHMAGALQERTRALERQTRDLEEFVYIASHDLQSPLISIQGFADRVAGPQGPTLDEDQRRWVERIQANVDHMGALIRGILDLSRLNTRREGVRRAPARRLVDQALEPLRDVAAAQGAELVVQGADWPLVEGDLPRLQSVFGNLVDNALKYLGDDNAHPTVEVGCRLRPDGAEFWVRDNGVGIDPEHQERVFRPLERLKTVEVHGAGMGLTLVRKIVETHGGELTLESAAGQGAEFRFTLPLVAGSEAE